MKYPFKSLLLAATVLAAASCAKDDTQSGGEETAGPVIVNASPAAIGGEIILKLKTEASGIVEKSRAQGVSKGSGIDEIDRILNTVNTVRFERLFPDGGRFEERTRREGLHLWYYAKYDPSVPTSEMASLLSSCKDIEIIEYSLAAETSDHRRAASPAAGAQSVTRAIADEVRNVPFPFNESERSQQMQWHYNNTGNIFAQTSQLGADANVYAAWQLSTGNPDVIVAVVDQGVKYDHEDLAANMWVNEAELNGTPGVDDDGNGYVDDIYGYNFTKETGELDFSAELMHGTHVAGTIAAVNNNGVGVCGIAGGSGRGDGVKIMSCEILGKSESGSSGAGLAGQIRAIKYAADNGRRDLPEQLGIHRRNHLRDRLDTRFLLGALACHGVLQQICGTGRKRQPDRPDGRRHRPLRRGQRRFERGLLSRRRRQRDQRGRNRVHGRPAYYTNYGTWVQISAPGGDQMLSNAYGGVYSTSVAADGSSGYEGSQGTSMACPHVSGACALAVSYYYGAEKRKGLTGEMLRQALLSSTQSVDRYCTGKYQQYLGNMGIGSLDTYKLLRNIAKIDGIPAQRVGVGDTVSIDLSNHFTATNVLGYTVSVPDLVKIELRGGVMKLTGLKKGRTTIIVSDGAAIRKPIEVTVE